MAKYRLSRGADYVIFPPPPRKIVHQGSTKLRIRLFSGKKLLKLLLGNNLLTFRNDYCLLELKILIRWKFLGNLNEENNKLSFGFFECPKQNSQDFK